MRCFVAIDLPPDVREAVARVQASVRAAAPRADVRWTEPAGLHLTVKFLGDVDEGHLPALREALDGVAGGGGTIALATGSPGAFPSPHRARVVWLGLSAGAAEVERLASAVDAALTPLGVPAEVRPYHAHLTLGRVRGPRGLGPLARAIEEVETGPPHGWVARELVLFQSHLRPTGAIHEPLARLPLRGGRT